LALEVLENRNLLSANPVFNPSPEAIELFERINRMRVDPQGELARIFSDIENGIANDPRITSAFKSRFYSYPTVNKFRDEINQLTAVAPLAWNNTLSILAEAHTELMISQRSQKHDLPGETHWENRILQAIPDATYYAENICAYGLQPEENGCGSVASFLHEFLVIDFGVSSHEHRNNVMDANLQSMGIGLLQVPDGISNFGPWVVTIDFADTTSEGELQNGGYLIGVTYADQNANGYYNAGEGLGETLITIKQGDTVVCELTSSDAGAYQQYLENGIYTVTASGAGFVQPITQVAIIDGQNVKADFCSQDIGKSKPVIDLNGSGEGINFQVAYSEIETLKPLVSADFFASSGNRNLLSYVIVTLNDRRDGNYELLLADAQGTGLATQYDSGTGVLIISGTASVADYTKVLKTLRYQNTLERPNLELRTIDIVASNGFTTSDAAIVSLKLDAAYIPDMFVEDARVIEGDDGTTDMIFTVQLSEAARQPVEINYATVAGSAVENFDYQPIENGTLILAADQTTAEIIVKINADYDAKIDRDLTLVISSATNVHLVKDTAIGTILDDDRITSLGRIAKWERDDYSFEDGRRWLYSFEAMYDGRVAWDGEFKNSDGTAFPEGAKIVVYEGSSYSADLTPIGFSAPINGKQHLDFDVSAGLSYLVKLEMTNAELPLEIAVAKMGQVVRSIDGGYEILGAINEPNEFTIDFTEDNVRIGNNGLYSYISRELYEQIVFGNVDSSDSLNIIGGGTRDEPLNVIPETGGENNPNDEYIIINNVPVKITGLKKIIITGKETYDSVHLLADGGNSRFAFENGNSILVTATRVYQTIGVEEVIVTAEGDANIGAIYDLPSKDCFTLRSNLVSFEGDRFHIEVRNFQTVDSFTFGGGDDLIKIYGENNSITVIGAKTVDRIDATSDYRVWNPETIIAVNKDETDNSILLVNSRPGDFYDCRPGYVTATNSRNSVSYTLIDFNNVVIASVGNGSSQAKIPELSDEITLTPDEKHNVLAKENQKVYIPLKAVLLSQPNEPLSQFYSSQAEKSADTAEETIADEETLLQALVANQIQNTNRQNGWDVWFDSQSNDDAEETDFAKDLAAYYARQTANLLYES
jgi:uncharacterized protein YkwD